MSLESQIEPGLFVRHSKCPDWGVGYVTECQPQKTHILFSEAGVKRFKPKMVKKLLVEVDPETLPSDSLIRTPAGRRELDGTNRTSSPARAPKVLKPLGVYSRDSQAYIDATLAVHKDSPEQEVTFGSGFRWKSVADYVDSGKSPIVFITPDDGSCEVRFTARIKRIVVDPKAGGTVAEELLGLMLKDVKTADEQDVDFSGSKTLYTLVNLEAVETPFPQSELKKYKDGEPVAENYSRAYCRVLDEEAIAAQAK